MIAELCRVYRLICPQPTNTFSSTSYTTTDKTQRKCNNLLQTKIIVSHISLQTRHKSLCDYYRSVQVMLEQSLKLYGVPITSPFAMQISQVEVTFTENAFYQIHG